MRWLRRCGLVLVLGVGKRVAVGVRMGGGQSVGEYGAVEVLAWEAATGCRNILACLAAEAWWADYTLVLQELVVALVTVMNERLAAWCGRLSWVGLAYL
jgi:hypothetical protein